MHRILRAGLLLASAGWLSTASAVDLLKGDWEEASQGGDLPAAWKAWTGNSPGSQGTVTVSEENPSPFGKGRKCLRIEGTAAGGVFVQAGFPSTDKGLQIDFDVCVLSPGVLPSFTLGDGEGKGGFVLNLVNIFAQPGKMLIVNQALTSADPQQRLSGEIVGPMAVGVWHHVSIETTPPGKKAFYILTVTPWNAPDAPLMANRLPIPKPLAAFGRIQFGWNSNNGKGLFLIDNLDVSTLP